MRASRVLAALAFVAPLVGCVLVAPPLDIGDHCGIQGDTECATCIRKSCEAPIDACCGSSSCAGASVLGDMDACGRGENPRCVDSLATARTTKTEEDVRACASKSCRDVCTKGATGSGGTQPKWTCTTAREPASACGTCVYEKCGTALDTCCEDSSCKNDSTIQTDVGACVAGDAPGCVYGQTDNRSTSGQQGVVRKCILDSCKSVCFGEGYPHTSCTLQAGGTYCTCADAEKSNGTACDATVVGGRCIRGTEGCTCGNYECSGSSECSCSFHGESSSAPSTCRLSGSAERGACCLRVESQGVSCKCGQYESCSASLDEYDITSCDLDDVLARASQLFVTTCSR